MPRVLHPWFEVYGLDALSHLVQPILLVSQQNASLPVVVAYSKMQGLWAEQNARSMGRQVQQYIYL